MKMIPKSRKHERALRADISHSQTILNRDANATNRHTNTATGVAHWNAWRATMYEMVSDDKRAAVSESLISNTFMRTFTPLNTISREKLRSLIKLEVEPAGKTVR